MEAVRTQDRYASGNVELQELLLQPHSVRAHGEKTQVNQPFPIVHPAKSATII